MAAKKPGIRSIRIRKGDRVIHVHGALAGREGVWLAKSQVQGLYDAPVKTIYKTGAYQEGSTHRFTKRSHRDLVLGFFIKETHTSYELNDSVLRQMFDYQVDPWDLYPEPTTIEVETDISGIRKLDVLMYEEPEFLPDLDPLMQEFGNCIFKLRAPDPMWYEDDAVDSFSSDAWSAVGTVVVSNPTDNVMYHKWVLTPGYWGIPDLQWVGAKGERVPGGPNGARYLSGVTITPANGGAVGDLDRMALMWRDANNTNILGQLGSTKLLAYPIPPYTPPTELSVGYSDAPGGAMVQLVMPRRWSRPWGLEIVTDESWDSPSPVLTSFSTAQGYSYHIPEWADAVDVILLGGGGGGDGAGSAVSQGGLGGEWVTETLIRGVDIPWESDLISGTVGRGGMGGTAGVTGGPGQYGNQTTATATGMVSLAADGGAGGGAPAMVGKAPSPQVKSFNGRSYYGGSDSPPGWSGAPPGGGGSAGWVFQVGWPGGNGRAWFYAYALSGSS